jgi:hypothetical protein
MPTATTTLADAAVGDILVGPTGARWTIAAKGKGGFVTLERVGKPAGTRGPNSLKRYLGDLPSSWCKAEA